MSAVLLDTCAAIWLNDSEAMKSAAVEAISAAARSDGVYVSVISGWEIGLLSTRGSASALAFHPDPAEWLARLMAQPAIRIAPLTLDMAFASTVLPGDFHRDPADRFIVTTARAMRLPIVTRDHRILDYAKAGHVTAIDC